MFLMVFGIAIRLFELAAAFWTVASADECTGWKLIFFPCVSAMRDEPERDWSQDEIQQKYEARHPSQTSQKFAPGRPLIQRLFGDGWAVGRVDQTFLVCFPDGSSARYEMSLQLLPTCCCRLPACLHRALDRGRLRPPCSYTEDELDADFTIEDTPTRTWVRADSKLLDGIKAKFDANGKLLEQNNHPPHIFHKYRGHGIVEELPSSRYFQWFDKLSLMLTVRAASPLPATLAV